VATCELFEHARDVVNDAGVFVHPHGAHYFGTSSRTFADNLRQLSDFVSADNRVLTNINGYYV
jgi:UDP-galactopyranose mutase